MSFAAGFEGVAAGVRADRILLHVAGATALLAAVNADIRAIGWYYLPVVLLSSALALAVALLTNNIQRRYPVFWIAPPAPPAPAKAAPNPTPATTAAGTPDNATLAGEKTGEKMGIDSAV